MKKLLLLLLFSLYFFAVPSADAAITDFQTPPIFSTPDDINTPDQATGSALPIIWTGNTDSGIRVSGLQFVLPPNSTVDGVAYKFSITSSVSGQSWLPKTPLGSTYYYWPNCTSYISTNSPLGYKCQYNTINGTQSNVTIATIASGAARLTPSDVANPALKYEWSESALTSNQTLTAFQVAIIYHEGEEASYCGNIFVLADMCGVLAGLFLPDTNFATSSFSTLKTTMLDKVPFAYIQAALDLDFSDSATPSSTPTLTLPIDHTNSYISSLVPNNMVWTNAGSQSIVSTTTASFRSIFQVLLWVAFIFYLFVSLRRVL